jgi:hypothetical protein
MTSAVLWSIWPAILLGAFVMHHAWYSHRLLTTSAEICTCRRSMTLAVLWGIWPAILLGAFVSHLVYKWRLRPLAHFRAAQKAAEEGRLQVETVSALKSIYR